MLIVLLVITGMALLFFTLWPALQAAEPLVVELDATERRRNLLEQEKRSNLRAIKDIDFELATGKISAEDHEELKTLYSLKIADIIDAEKRLNEGAGGDA